jgi:hypothetical protein
MAAVNTAIVSTTRSQERLDALKKTAHCRELAGEQEEAAEGVGGGTAVNFFI